MDIQQIRNEIVQRLHQHTEKPVVMLEHNREKPPYPFVAYQITTPYAKGLGMSVKTDKTVPSDSEEFDFDVKETLTDQPKITISFTAYSKDSVEAMELAIKVRDWFLLGGYRDFKSIDVVVEEIQGIENRDTLIVDDYERRAGFDVILRTTHETNRIIEGIESYKQEGEVKK